MLQKFHPGDKSCPESTNATSAKIGAVNSNKTVKDRTDGPPAAGKRITAGKAAIPKAGIGLATRNTDAAAMKRWVKAVDRTCAGAVAETEECGKAAVSAGATKAVR